MTAFTVKADRFEIKDGSGNVIAHSDMTLEEAVAAVEATDDPLARYWLGLLIDAKTNTEADTAAMLSAALQKKTPKA